MSADRADSTMHVPPTDRDRGDSTLGQLGDDHAETRYFKLLECASNMAREGYHETARDTLEQAVHHYHELVAPETVHTDLIAPPSDGDSTEYGCVRFEKLAGVAYYMAKNNCFERANSIAKIAVRHYDEVCDA